MKARQIERVGYSKKFLKQARKLPQTIIAQAEHREKIFKRNAFDPCLKTHKLHGKQKELWAFWVDYSYRIIFVFTADQEVLFLEIGAHDLYA